MSYKNRVFRNLKNSIGNFFYRRGVSNQVIVDTGKSRNEIRNFTLRVYKRSELVDNLIPIVFENGDFGNLVSFYTVSGSLYVDDTVQLKWVLDEKLKLGQSSATAKIVFLNTKELRVIMYF